MATAQTELTTEQTELIEKLNCLEFETSQLNRAYQLWRSYVEQGKAPDWMAAAIRITYDDLMKFCLNTVLTVPADVPLTFSAKRRAQLEAVVCEISGAAEPSPKLLPMTVAISPPSTADTTLEQLVIQPGQDRCNCRECARAQEEEAGAGISDILEDENMTAEPSPELLPMPVAFSPSSAADTISEQLVVQQGQQEEEAGSEVAGSLEEESTSAEAPAELLPMPVAISPPSTADAISEQLVIQRRQREEDAGAEPAAIHSLATLANWPQGSSTEILFFVPPGALGKLLRAASVAILILAGGAIAIYLASAHRVAPKAAILPVQNSTAPAAAGPVVTPTSERAGFTFDPDPVVAPLGRPFVLNAVLSRGSDIASMAVQIDYDANLLQFKSVSQGGFLVKAGKQVVVAERDDPSTGILRISAEKSPGSPGFSGDGPVFALSFQARKKGNATVSIVPGAHDSQGRRIEMAGSQVSVRVN